MILAIFASYAQRQQQPLTSGNRPLSDRPPQPSSSSSSPLANAGPNSNGALGKQKHVSDVIHSDAESKDLGSEEESRLSETFVKYMVPFYAKCLIDVSFCGEATYLPFRISLTCLEPHRTRSTGGSTHLSYDSHTQRLCEAPARVPVPVRSLRAVYQMAWTWTRTPWHGTAFN